MHKNKEKYLNDHTSSYKYPAARYLILLIIYQQIAKVRKKLITAQMRTNKQIASIIYSKKKEHKTQVIFDFCTGNKEEQKLGKIYFLCS